MGFTLYSSGNASSFWLGDDFDNDFRNDTGVDYTKLASTQRAIGNFVNIVTGKQIPVEFQSNDNSFTDGKTVVIGTKLDGDDFDPTVGLALHEGSHIAFTDFDVLRDFSKNVRMHGVDPDMTMTYNDELIIKDLLNWIEDRRIDYLIYTKAPGYRMYYESMYNKYFNDKVIDKALREKRKTEETLEDYFFHIINFTNPHRDLTQLELLHDIWNIIDLKNISRLKNTQDALTVSCDIYKLLKPHLDKETEQSQDQKGNPDQSQGECDTGDLDGDDDTDDGSKDDDGSTVDGEPSTNSNDKEPLTDRQQKILNNAMERQRNFLNGNEKKKGRLTKSQSYTVKALREAGTEVVMVDLGYEKIETIVIKKLTKNVIDHMPSLFTNYNDNGHVLKGIRLGKILGKKLQIRNDDRTLKSTRLETGKIDRRLISQLGYNNVNVFHKIVADRYKDYFIHISIDASGSMNGNKFMNSLTSAIAIAQAASMTTGIRIQISLRGTSNIGKSNNYSNRCTTLIAYDSKTDKMAKIRKLFVYLDVFGVTPEGVAFKSIEKQIIQDSNGCECIFINYSDGYPSNMGQSNVGPIEYTRIVINQFRDAGMGIVSYFISSGYNDLTKFKRMYGTDAEHINPENMIQVSRTMNSKFLEKSK